MDICKTLTYCCTILLSFSLQAGEFCYECSRSHIGGAELSNIKDTAMNRYDVTFYWIDIEVSDTSTFVKGNTAINARSVQVIDELVFELSDDHFIDSIFINGILQTDYSHLNDLIRINAIPSIPDGLIFESVIYYHGAGGKSSFFAGISNRTDFQWDKKVTYTLSESFNANDWFVCKQVLTDKADSAYIYLTTSDHLKAGSNGLLTGIDSLPGKMVKYKWETHYPVAYYLLSLSVSEYLDYSFYAISDGTSDSILVQNFIYNDSACLDNYKEEIDITSDMLDYYSGVFGAYPFREEKYGHSLAPMGGGMEHQTMTTLHNFNFTLVAHELVHQWFGDNVTCKSWQDIWINEGFASYGEYLALESLDSKKAAETWMTDAHYWALTEPEGSIYIPEQDANSETRIFSRALSYKKGAALLHMLRDELNNDSIFFQVFKNFQNVFRDSTASGSDFLNVLNETSGQDFSWFFNQWYYGSGFPELKFSWWQTEGYLNLQYEQSGSSLLTPIFRLNMEFEVEYADGTDSIFSFVLDEKEEQFEIPNEKDIIGVIADPDNWILEKSNLIRRYISEGQFYVSPNPFEEKLNVLFKSDKNREISLTDMNGKVLKRWKTTSADVILETNQISQGIYLIKVKEGNNRFMARILKQ
jgi:aminopeptidase N